LHPVIITVGSDKREVTLQVFMVRLKFHNGGA